MSQTTNSAPAFRLNLCKTTCEVRDDRWAIHIDAGDSPVGIRVAHRKFGDYYDWPEALYPDGNTASVMACNRAYDLTEELTFHTRGKALAAAHGFLKVYGAGEVEYLEWDVDSQTMVVVGHAPREGAPMFWPPAKPDLLASFYPHDSATASPTPDTGSEEGSNHE